MIFLGTRRETIEQWSFCYFLAKGPVRLAMRAYFRIKTINKHKIPKNDIVIFAANHQNALIDALAVLITIKNQPVFLARADIFNKPSIIKALTFIKILPIFRIRDGKEQLKKNEEIFNKTIDVLKVRKRLAILPEGSHAGFRRLRTLKKGIARIVFQAEEANDFKLNIKIVPVGLNYGHYSHVRSRLLINYGDPISVSDFYDLYKENGPRAMNMLREKVSAELKKQMIHIENEEFYDMQNELARFYAPRMIKILNLNRSNQENTFVAENKIIEITNQFIQEKPEEAKDLDNKLRSYLSQLKKLNFRSWVIRERKFSFVNVLSHTLLLISGFPLFLYGLINNYIPFKIPVIMTRKVKDPQFVSSFRIVIALLLFIVFYIIQGTLFAIFYKGPFWVDLLYIASLFPTGLFAISYYISLKKLFAKWRFSYMKFSGNKKLKNLIGIFNDIDSKVDEIYQDYK